MDEPERLIGLLEILRAHGVTHYKDNELELSLSLAEVRPVVSPTKDTGAKTNPMRPMYQKLFPHGAPSFRDFKDAGLVTEEK